MNLFFDDRDLDVVRHDARLRWLADLGARPLSTAREDDEGFLFAGCRSMDDYARVVSRHPRLRDRPGERAPLMRLDAVLDALSAAGVSVPTPRTWRLDVNEAPPDDLEFPLFVRTAVTSLKRGGKASKVRNGRELHDEAEVLRRATHWDATVLARRWVDLAVAGHGMYGPVPRELRVWLVDGVPRAWSFHYLNVLRDPDGFPPARAELDDLARLAADVGRAFRSRLVAADFAWQKAGGWVFIEAGPGSCAGTAHEVVFKAVADLLRGREHPSAGDAHGGLFPRAAAPRGR